MYIIVSSYLLCQGGSRDRMAVGFTTTYASVPITTNVVS